MSDPLYGYYVTIGPNPIGSGFMAVITDGSPRLEHEHITVMDMKIVDSVDEGRVWFAEAVALRPWEVRN